MIPELPIIKAATQRRVWDEFFGDMVTETVIHVKSRNGQPLSKDCLTGRQVYEIGQRPQEFIE